jgi:hypothetical protein
MARSLAVLVLCCSLVAAVSPASAEPACKVGDSACWCKAAPINGEWQPNKDPLFPACRIYFKHSGENCNGALLRAHPAAGGRGWAGQRRGNARRPESANRHR